MSGSVVGQRSTLSLSDTPASSNSEQKSVPLADSMYEILQKVKDGEDAAVQEMWNRYFPQLVSLAGKRLQGERRQVADEEDVAASVLESFFRAARADRFPDLKDKDGIWRLLSKMTHRKVIDQVRRNAARPALGESAIQAGSGLDNPLASLASADPTPAMIAMLTDEIEHLLEVLPQKYRPVAAKKLECLTVPEIAAHCGVHISTVERRLRIIRGLWSKELEKL